MDASVQGTPWLGTVMLHSSREYECTLNSTELCDYQQGYWRFWYQADHRYALPTVAFFTSTIILFSLVALARWLYRPTSPSPSIQRARAASRYLSYRTLRISRLNWNTAPVGILLLGAVGVILFFSMTLGPKPYYWPNTATINFGDSPPIATRAGWMSLGCLPFVIATASKSNMISAVTGVPHERLQVFHRWISYAMYVLALIHTFPFIIHSIATGTMVMNWNMEVQYWTGVVAILAQSWLTFASFSPLRNLHYELFKFTHFLAAFTFILFFFFHCDFTLTSWDYFIVTAVIYTLTWLHTQLRIYFTHGAQISATVELISSNHFLRLRIPTRTRWHAGQHFFLRFPELGWTQAWSSHPFTACSLPPRAQFFEGAEAEMVFYIRPRKGVTATLAKRALAAENGEAQVRVRVDGPYGGVEMRGLVEARRLVVIVGGSGSGFALPLIESFLRRREVEGRDAEVSMRVVLATRERELGRWLEDAVSALLKTYDVNGSAALTLEIHYTGSAALGKMIEQISDPVEEDVEKGAVVGGTSIAGSQSGSDDAQESPSSLLRTGQSGGRPDLPSIIAEEAMLYASTGVYVCGPLSMQHDVANAVAREQLRSVKGKGPRDISLHTEHFSWA